MNRLVFLVLALSLLLCQASGLAFDIKWSQPPQFNSESPMPQCYWGWDEPSLFGDYQIAADDWLCEDNRPVIGVRWWGSHVGWEGPQPPVNTPPTFHIGIWTDVPAGGTEPWSHPGTMIWEHMVSYTDVTVEPVGCDFHPMHGMDTCFMYEIFLPEDKWFYQEPGPTVYWISISAMYDEPNQDYPWGWKTREHFFNDAAVRIFDPTLPILFSIFMQGEPIYEPDQVPWDLSFELFTEDQMPTSTPTASPRPTETPVDTPTPTPTLEPNVKWSQPPQYNPQSPNPMCFWGWDEYSVYGSQQIVADDWLCEQPVPVTRIRWWGSYLGWDAPEPPPQVPDMFHIGIWTDVPAGVSAPWSHPGTLIWESIVPLAELRETYAGCDFYPGHPVDTCFTYEYVIPDPEWFFQEPGSNIYWLSISAMYQFPPDLYAWGWKTREHYFNDAAIKIYDPTMPVAGSSYVNGYPIYEPEQTPWDLTFVLYSDSYPTPTFTPTNTPTNTPTPTYTPTIHPTVTPQPPTNTPTHTPTNTNTPTSTPTNTPTATQSPPPPPTNTPTITPTAAPPTNTPTSVPPTNTPTATSTPCVNHGDVNFDGLLTAGDAQTTFFIVLGTYTPTTAEWCAADCDGNGSVTAGDAQTIFLAALGMGACSDPLPTPTP